MNTENCIYLKDTSSITGLFDLLLSEWKKSGYTNILIIEGLLKAILGVVLRQSSYPRPKLGSKTEIFRQFEEMLFQTDALYNSVAHYALLLHTTPQNLNAVCRKESGKPAASIVAIHLLGEAKRLLAYTGLTVGEIAARLNFRDSSHFIKYFKRHTGITPGAFRQLP